MQRLLLNLWTAQVTSLGAGKEEHMQSVISINQVGFYYKRDFDTKTPNPDILLVDSRQTTHSTWITSGSLKLVVSPQREFINYLELSTPGVEKININTIHRRPSTLDTMHQVTKKIKRHHTSGKTTC